MRLEAFSKHGLTADEIASVVGVARTTVIRNRRAQDYLLGKFSNPRGGAPVTLYNPDVLVVWGRSADEIAETIRAKNRKPRNDVSKPRTGESAEEAQAREMEIVSEVRRRYLEGDDVNGIQRITTDVCVEIFRRETNPGFDGKIGKWSDPLKMSKYYYKQRIMRKPPRARRTSKPTPHDKYIGYAHYWQPNNDDKIPWKDQWKAIHRKKLLQPELPRDERDMLRMLFEAGLIDKGRGAGYLWVYDGVDAHHWVRKDGAEGSTLSNFKQPKTAQIICGLTGYPLHIEPIESEDSESLCRVFANCAIRHGVPRWGIILDNSGAARSPAVRGFLRKFYSDQAVRDFETSPALAWLRKLFKGQKYRPLYYNLANIPTFPRKALIERSFRMLHIYSSEQQPQSFQRNMYDKVNHDLSTTPYKAMLQAPGETEMRAGRKENRPRLGAYGIRRFNARHDRDGYTCDPVRAGVCCCISNRCIRRLDETDWNKRGAGFSGRNEGAYAKRVKSARPQEQNDPGACEKMGRLLVGCYGNGHEAAKRSR